MTLTNRQIAHFWKHVIIRNDEPADCWEWKGSTDKSGYPNCRLVIRGKAVNPKAHRVSWIIHFGDIPDGMNVLHRYDIFPQCHRACVNPVHLSLGDAYELRRMAEIRREQVEGDR